MNRLLDISLNAREFPLVLLTNKRGGEHNNRLPLTFDTVELQASLKASFLFSVYQFAFCVRCHLPNTSGENGVKKVPT